MKEIVKRLLENHVVDKEEDAIEESDEFSSRDDMAAILSEDENEEEEVLEESDMKTVTQSAQRVLNTYENILAELQTLKKGSGYCASNTISKKLTPDDYKKRDVANGLVLDKLHDMQSLMKSIRDIVARAK